MKIYYKDEIFYTRFFEKYIYFNRTDLNPNNIK